MNVEEFNVALDRLGLQGAKAKQLRLAYEKLYGEVEALREEGTGRVLDALREEEVIKEGETAEQAVRRLLSDRSTVYRALHTYAQDDETPMQVLERVLVNFEAATTPMSLEAAGVLKDLVVGLCAEVTHEINRAYCASIGDDSQVPWAEAEEWQKRSAISGVLFVLERFPEITPGDSHRSWLAEKEADGWVYGETKDPEKKVHPCMRPFEDLPREQQVKDHLFIAGVVAVKAALERYYHYALRDGSWSAAQSKVHSLLFGDGGEALAGPIDEADEA